MTKYSGGWKFHQGDKVVFASHARTSYLTIRNTDEVFIVTAEPGPNNSAIWVTSVDGRVHLVRRDDLVPLWVAEEEFNRYLDTLVPYV